MSDYLRVVLLLMASSTTLLNLVLPVLTMSITFAFYTLVQKQELTASKGKHYVVPMELD